MAEIIRMPRMSDTMTEGIFVKWLKKLGDKVKSGDVLAEVETDKATMELESFQEGHLLYIGVKEGEAAPIDSIIAILGNTGEDISSYLSENKAIENLSLKTEESVPKIGNVNNTSEESKSNVQSEGDRVKASPLAKKIANDKGINLQIVQGSGEGGRIVKRDIENINTTVEPKAIQKAYENAYTDLKISSMRKTIARRLGESKFTAPHFYLTIEIIMDNVLAARKQMNAEGTHKISVNDLVVKACALSLKKHPVINSSWLGDVIRVNHHVNIGIAVAIEDGLIVPVIPFANEKTLAQISTETKILAEKAKTKELKPEEFSGNTFTISNLGMFGIEEFTAIINPPDACILAVGASKEAAIVKNGQISIANVMKVTLSCDHRVVDGASGAAFLKTLKQFLEEPILMLL
jgi:pyruvate dehydrogenase E2 component (dihydrolipoamide acetyltransferase)